jgi:Fe-S-cluster-containing dehydrogenase component
MQKCDLCYQLVDLSKDQPPCAATCPTKALVVKQMTSAEKAQMQKAMSALLAS